MLMITRCFNKPFLIALVTAFLFLQWSAVHVHLSDEHAHDEGLHQHTVTAHQHQLDSHHPDAIDVNGDSLSHADSNKIVELDHACTQVHGKFAQHYASLPPCTWDAATRSGVYLRGAVVPQSDTYQAYHQYTALRLRAPPANS